MLVRSRYRLVSMLCSEALDNVAAIALGYRRKIVEIRRAIIRNRQGIEGAGQRAF